MKVVSHIIAAAIGAIAVVVVAIVVTPRPAAPEPTAVSNVAADLPASAPRTRPAPVAMQRPSSSPSAVGGGLRQRVDGLIARGTARERYQAFVVLSRCAGALDFDRHLRSLPAGSDTMRLQQRYGDGAARIAAVCGDLSARQIEQRIELAARAADEGVAGAASAWVEEGPYGDKTALTQRPDDPLVVEWARQAIERVNAATRRSDTEAIGQFGLLCLNWELDDVARLRLLVDTAAQRRHEDQIKSVLN